MMTQKILLTISLMFLFVVCVELLSSMPPEPNPEDLYCEMRQLHIDTDGVYGWPAYNKQINCDGAISAK